MKPALPSSTGCSTTFTGLKTEKHFKETALTRTKLGVVVKKQPNLLVPDYSASSSSDNEGG